MPAEEFIALMSNPAFLGDPLLMTQHLVATTKWELVSPTEAIGHHQIYAPHQKYKDASKAEVLLRGYAHGTNKHWYSKVRGTWKFAGLQPDIRWTEYDFDKIFAFARDLFGSDGQ
jgi:scytalone dehydratase